MVTLTKNEPPVSEITIDVAKLERLRSILGETHNSISGALSLMDDEGAFAGLNS
jgi:hypothetical protein